MATAPGVPSGHVRHLDQITAHMTASGDRDSIGRNQSRVYRQVPADSERPMIGMWLETG